MAEHNGLDRDRVAKSARFAMHLAQAMSERTNERSDLALYAAAARASAAAHRKSSKRRRAFSPNAAFTAPPHRTSPNVLGIRQASLYYYFSSKEAALELVCLKGVEGFFEAAKAIAAGRGTCAGTPVFIDQVALVAAH